MSKEKVRVIEPKGRRLLIEPLKEFNAVQENKTEGGIFAPVGTQLHEEKEYTESRVIALSNELEGEFSVGDLVLTGKYVGVKVGSNQFMFDVMGVLGVYVEIDKD